MRETPWPIAELRIADALADSFLNNDSATKQRTCFKPPLPLSSLAPIPAEDCSSESIQFVRQHCVAEALHQPLIEPEIVLGHQHGTQDLARFHQVMDIGALEMRAGGAWTTRLDRLSVLGKAGVAH